MICEHGIEECPCESTDEANRAIKLASGISKRPWSTATANGMPWNIDDAEDNPVARTAQRSCKTPDCLRDANTAYIAAAGSGYESLARQNLVLIEKVQIMRELLAKESRGEVITHVCPITGEALTSCCKKTPFELPRTDRLSIYEHNVNCDRSLLWAKTNGDAKVIEELRAKRDTACKELDKAKQALSDIANGVERPLVQCLIAHLHEGTKECSVHDGHKGCLACQAVNYIEEMRQNLEQTRRTLHETEKDMAASLSVQTYLKRKLSGEWTPIRPNSGDWWVALHPSKRGEFPAVMDCVVNGCGDVFVWGASPHVTEEMFNSALWLKRKAPDDPFYAGTEDCSMCLGPGELCSKHEDEE